MLSEVDDDTATLRLKVQEPSVRNLLGRLLERSGNDLDRIATFWDVELGGRDRYSDVAAIYRAMTNIWAARDVWEQLDPTAQQLIETMLRLDDGAQSPDELAQLAELDGEEATEALRGLYLAGIVALEEASEDTAVEGEQSPELFLPREIASIFERVTAERDDPLPENASLDEILACPPMAEIEEAASRWGAKIAPGLQNRAELVKLLGDQLSRPERADRFVRNLSAPARELWFKLKDAGGELPYREVLPNQRPASRRQIVRELAGPLLVWHDVRSDPSEPGSRMLVIPEAILHPKRPEPPPLPELTTFDPDDVLEPEWQFPEAATWDLLTILREVVVSSPRWNALVEDDPAISRRFRGRLWAEDRDSGDLPTGYIPFLTRAAAQLGVLQDLDGRAAPGPAASDWRCHAFSTAQRDVVQAWVQAESWIEGRGRLDMALYGASWPAYRATLMRALGELEPDTWYGEEAFIERLLHAEPDLLRQARVGAVPSSQLQMQIDRDHQADDPRLATLRLIVETTMATAGRWLNLLEFSQASEAGTRAFRLTPLGNWIAGRGPEPAGQQLGPAPIGVGANFQVLLYRPTPRRVWTLSAFSELQALDRVSTYTLTAPALIRALASGVNLDDVVRVLESQSGQELPQTVAYTLAEWDQGYRRVWLRRAVFLVPEEGEDSQAIASVLRDVGLDPEVLDDGRILLPHDAPDAGERLYGAAARALRERGFAPLTEHDLPSKRHGRSRSED